MNTSPQILVIDDDPIVLESTRSQLEDAGYRVIVNNSASGTARIILSNSPDIVLVDVMMPGLTGDEFVGFITENQIFKESDIGFILYSSKDSQELNELVRKSGALGAIQKTGNKDDFLAELASLIAKKKSLPAAPVN